VEVAVGVLVDVDVAVDVLVDVLVNVEVAVGVLVDTFEHSKRGGGHVEVAAEVVGNVGVPVDVFKLSKSKLDSFARDSSWSIPPVVNAIRPVATNTTTQIAHARGFSLHGPFILKSSGFVLISSILF